MQGNFAPFFPHGFLGNLNRFWHLERKSQAGILLISGNFQHCHFFNEFPKLDVMKKTAQSTTPTNQDQAMVSHRKATPSLTTDPGMRMTRRRWIQTVTLAGLGSLFGIFDLRLRADAKHPIHLALLADTHIPQNVHETYRGFSMVQNMKEAVPQIIAADPDLAVFCGDLARLKGLPGDYQQLRKLLTPMLQQVPALFALGNHDNRQNFRAAFGDLIRPSPLQSKHIQVDAVGSVRLILLDSLQRPNYTPGLLGKEQLRWLEKKLQQDPQTPTVLFFHHTLGHNKGDLQDVDQLLALTRQHPQVKALCYGHSHVWHVEKRDRLQWINVPALGYSFSPQQPVGWVEAWLRPDGVRLQLRVIRPGTGHYPTELDLSFS